MRTWKALSAVGLLVAAVPLLGGCRSATEAYADVFLRGTTLTYEQYLSQDVNAVPPVTADALIAALGPPADVYDRDGARRRIDYNAFSLTGELKHAEFYFDREERLVKKELW